MPTKTGPSKLTLAMFELPAGKGEMSVGCSAPVTKRVATSVVLDGARDGMLKNIGARLGSEREVIGGREVLFEVQDQQGLARLFWLNNRVIIATVMPVGAFGGEALRQQCAVGRAAVTAASSPNRNFAHRSRSVPVGWGRQ